MHRGNWEREREIGGRDLDARFARDKRRDESDRWIGNESIFKPSNRDDFGLKAIR